MLTTLYKQKNHRSKPKGGRTLFDTMTSHEDSYKDVFFPKGMTTQENNYMLICRFSRRYQS
ncbi:hypothetical protein KY290_002866 [Solanum tuberosum]|uniref:Uncharacterized protein n=1 Tax=Solanum tuberosum TaxID=4113 RepID=A0ABQ7WT95_SOLTU|nr:hypothetical protein KY284_002991 [Solanum tuberosum]KAH0766942.1 hypothetical protein KY285_002813 [Solanum tuberosum]KAH0783268.1 hypothetical protein KY290_002866 [Solanum tuberosum]